MPACAPLSPLKSPNARSSPLGENAYGTGGEPAYCGSSAITRLNEGTAVVPDPEASEGGVGVVAGDSEARPVARKRGADDRAA